MSDAYSEHVIILQCLLLLQQWLKSQVWVKQTTFSTYMGLASTLAMGVREMVDTITCSLKCLNKTKEDISTNI